METKISKIAKVILSILVIIFIFTNKSIPLIITLKELIINNILIVAVIIIIILIWRVKK
jgi:hypothetical protein